MVRAVRGAVFVDENSAESIGEGVRSLVKNLVSVNQINESDIISILFSQTKDLTKANPAGSLRKDGYADVPLFCTQEPEYPNSHPKVIRVLVTFLAGQDRRPQPVYLNGAEKLRQDVFKKK